nr:uncharacterized protein LOC104650615 [Saimiri boliviensis boliviensis]
MGSKVTRSGQSALPPPALVCHSPVQGSGTDQTWRMAAQHGGRVCTLVSAARFLYWKFFKKTFHSQQESVEVLGAAGKAAAHGLCPFQLEPPVPPGAKRMMPRPPFSFLCSPVVQGRPVHIYHIASLVREGSMLHRDSGFGSVQNGSLWL